jgi:hypothetical protein
VQLATVGVERVLFKARALDHQAEGGEISVLRAGVPGVTGERVMQKGSGEGREIVNMEELTRAVTASETEPTTADFAPPGNPRRIQRLAELTGASIRRTCADAGRAVIELVDQADAVVAQLRNDANGFVQSLDEIGNAHAARIERALTHLRGLVETIGTERRRIVALADTHHTHREERPHTPAEDLARENFPA